MLILAYGAAVVIGASSSFLPSKLVTVGSVPWQLFMHVMCPFINILLQILGHSALASFLWVRAQSVDLTSKASVTSFYMFIWKVSGLYIN